mmetsp:Transcript_3611/g.5376  ORF Transcript_3611/g.5376 Transcript_3611/m.5376 type:complete len:98 (+) Transcript_3611:152-445(+)|eukprot:CAMPEP_0172425392 /NCGR_PEP_ID=MMETSP1064-20121228/31746_1 /TAXON_ID=202472 /ORGANISM="Aulacoseira subarctica , Strain CCAP 1002/5" /LENGTH=97 /DNA_ID=CAMNT_0013168215 /DNA_START=121 /DNA_END=414 /DNA_ORIENTATION=-
MRDLNDLIATIGEMKADNEKERLSRAAVKASEAEQKKKRQLAATEQEQIRKEDLMPELIELAENAVKDGNTLLQVSSSRLKIYFVIFSNLLQKASRQ